MDASDDIVFRFVPTAEDYRKGIVGFYFRQTSFRVLIGVSSLLFSVGACLWAGVGIGRAPYAPVLALFLPFLLLTMTVLQPWLATRQVNKHERMRSETTWSISDEGVVVSSAYGQSKMDWGTFGKVIETGQHFLLLYSWNRRLFQIVPKRAFTSSEEMKAFRSMLERHIPGYKG